MYSLDSISCNVTATTAVALTSAADGLVFTPSTPVEIISFGYIITTAISGSPTSGFVAALDKRVTAASDTGRVAGGLGTLTLTNAQVLVGQTAGAGYTLRSRPAAPTTGEGALVVLPGQQAIFKITTALTGGSAAGSGIQFVEYKNLARGDQATTKEIIVTA